MICEENTEFDYVIKHKETGKYCAYNTDYEFEGWYLTELSEALGFGCIKELLGEFGHNGLVRDDYVICKREMKAAEINV